MKGGAVTAAGRSPGAQRAAELLAANERERDSVLSLSKCQLTAIPRRVLRLGHPLHALDLSANKLRQLHFDEEEEAVGEERDGSAEAEGPAEEARVAELRELNLSLNKLASNDIDALAPLARWAGLTRLDLSGNGFSRLPAGFWSVLPRGLEELKLSYNCLSELPPPFEEAKQRPDTSHNDGGIMTSLTALYIDCNGLAEIPATLPHFCPNLKQLLCADNVLKSFPTSFSAFRGLTNLDLSDNRVTALPTDNEFYTNLAPSLVQLTLKDNLITCLPGAFARLTALEMLNLRKNRIESFEALDLSSLRDLDLSCNKLRSLALSEKMTRLETLQLEHNQLEDLPSSIGSLPALLRLYAHDNKLAQIPEEMSRLTQLKELDLARNKFLVVPCTLDNMMRLPSVTFYRKSLPDEVIPGLFIGGAESASHLESLLHRKISLIVQVMVEAEQHFPSHFSYLTYRITDHPTSELCRYFEPCIEGITATLQSGGGVLVHCVAGISRSASIVAAFLMHHHKISFDHAMAMLRRSRPSVNPNPGFINQLQNFERELFGADSHQTSNEARCPQDELS